MALAPGTRIGPYEIIAPIGAGAMGEVYRAHDARIGRDVAVKVLPAAFAGDPERLARFEREARTLASLNHPHIAHIYGVEELHGGRAIVIELVEGEDLSQRISRGAIPLDEALSIARQLAEALEAAHGRGIIHRDLKPANIKVREDGTVKVLDFGLAKAMELSGASSADSMNSPTLSRHATQAGLILGTAPYMSPEQAAGKPVDKRTDLWAFGVVLFEMLTGRRLFDGETVSHVIAAVLTREPDWATLPPDTPPPVRRLLRRCLEKDRNRRLDSTVAARLEIDEAQTEPLNHIQGTQASSRRNERRAWLFALVIVTIVAAAIVLGLWGVAPSTTPLPEMRVEINTPPTTDPTSLAISPDGQTLAFVAISDGQPHLWLRPFNAVSARPLPDTDGASFPFWSPDSRSMAFFAYGQLRRIGIDGGSPRTLASALGGVGGTWSHDGVILFSRLGSPIFRISEGGGHPTLATRLDTQQGGHYLPQFLPDGRHFLYWAFSEREPNGVYVGQLDGSETRRLLDADFPAVWAPPDHLLFVRQGTLLAQRFDGTRLALVGTPVPVAEQVTSSSNNKRVAAVSTSAAGPIAYRTGSSGGGERQLAWFDRAGRQLANVGAPFLSTQLSPSLSRDGRRVALFRDTSGNYDVWLLDVRGVPDRFTFHSADDVKPLWSRDGSRIVFSSNRKGVHDLYLKSVSGAASDEALLLETAQFKQATDWSRDGRFLLFQSIDPMRNFDIWALPLDGDRRPFPVVQTDFEEHDGQFSPDGKWIAYVSIKSGRYEVYLQPFQRTGDEIRISSDGGDQVRWRPDGKELFYIAPDGQLVAVPIRPGANSETVEAGTPVRLFATRTGGWAGGLPGPQYVVSPDGLRFLMNTLAGGVSTSPVTVILHWKPRQ